MRHEYTVIYQKAEDGWYVATVPELPGAISQGRTLEEARFMIKDAVELLLQSYREDAKSAIEGEAIWETLMVEAPYEAP